MQPHTPEPHPGPTSPAIPAAPPDTPGPAISPPSTGPSVLPVRSGRFRSRRTRLWLALGAGILAVLCLGGVGVIVSLYDNATKIERTDPSVVIFNFLGAYLTDRNDQEAALYTCKEGLDISRLASFRDEVESVEKKYSIQVVITWQDLDVKTSGDRATATAEIVRTISDGSERTFKPWVFELVDSGGWRVCSASAAS
ncbi:Rv0361 family membrane protein [Actinoplanes octamycinicus]